MSGSHKTLFVILKTLFLIIKTLFLNIKTMWQGLNCTCISKQLENMFHRVISPKFNESQEVKNKY